MKTEKAFLRQFVFEKKFSLARHISFWSLSLIFLIALDFREHPSFQETLKTAFIYLPFNILFAYVIIYWFVPHFLIKEKYITFSLLYLLWIVVGLLINFGVRYFILIPMRNPPYVTAQMRADPAQIFRIAGFLIMNTMAMFAFPIKVFKEWALERDIASRFEKEKLSAELELLKAQLHPHFLFNTLNNLYTLVLEKSDKAPFMLLRLSGLLSYILYECKADEVPLVKEIAVIKNYVELERERYGDRLDISMSFTGDIEGAMISPMLFQPFIENAFKHGTSEQLGKVWVSIELSVKGNELVFKIINSCELKKPDEKKNQGIGMLNVQKRLAYLYASHFSLDYGQENDLFIVSLMLDLKNRNQAEFLKAIHTPHYHKTL